MRNIQYDQINIVETIISPILADVSEMTSGNFFLVELSTALFNCQGRCNSENLIRYSRYNELTHRRQFNEYLVGFSLNKSFVDFKCSVYIGVIDCSFINKSSKKTFGLDKFWTRIANKAKYGLEISVLGCINVLTGKATSLDADRTPISTYYYPQPILNLMHV